MSRFTANGDVVQAGTETILLELDNLSGATNHNGGSLNFGADGKLYIGVGENANGANSQSKSNLLGKMLRINAIDGSIPADNPFLATTTGKNQAIWAMGLRNPFTFGIQPGTGRIFIDDVGQSSWEEIDDGIAGANYGWPISEGSTNQSQRRDRTALHVPAQRRSAVTGCAITGGAFYNPSTVQFPASYVGKYFCSDLCNGWTRTVDPAAGFAVADFATGISSPVKMQVGPTGSLDYLYGAGGTGGVNRVDAHDGVRNHRCCVAQGARRLRARSTCRCRWWRPIPRRSRGWRAPAAARRSSLRSITRPFPERWRITEGGAVAGGPTFSGNNMIVPLTGVANAQYVTVTGVSSVSSSDGFSGGAGSVRLGVLRGDVNGTRTVTVADLGLVNAQLAQHGHRSQLPQ